MSDRSIDDHAAHDDRRGGSFDLGDAARSAWRTVTSAPQQWCAAMIALVLAAVLLNVVAGAVQGAIFGTGVSVGSLVIGLVFSGLTGAVSYLFVAVMVHGALETVEGRDFNAASAYGQIPKQRVLILGFLVTAGTAVGSILLVLPGLVFAVLSAFAVPALLDRELTAFGAIARSAQVVLANVKDALVISIAAAAIALAGVLACGIGAVVTMPVAIIVLTRGYVALDVARA